MTLSVAGHLISWEEVHKRLEQRNAHNAEEAHLQHSHTVKKKKQNKGMPTMLKKPICNTVIQ